MEAERGVAVDYAQIRDSRGKGELVFVSWIVPQWIQNAHIEPDKYVVLTVTHGKPSIGGTPHFENLARRSSTRTARRSR